MKTSITVEELALMLSKMRGGNSTDAVFNGLGLYDDCTADKLITDAEELELTIERYREKDIPHTFYSVAGDMIAEKKDASIGYALNLFSYANALKAKEALQMAEIFAELFRAPNPTDNETHKREEEV